MVTILLFSYVFLLLWIAWEDLRTLSIPRYLTLTGTLLGFFATSWFGMQTLPSNGKRVLLIDTGFSRSIFAEPRHAGLELTIAWCCILIWLWAEVATPLRASRGTKIALRIWFRSAKECFLQPQMWIPFALLLWISTVIWSSPAPIWRMLFQSLIGCAFGILSCEFYRVFVYFLARREAIGFGDVLLQGMIGAWSGWQVCAVNGLLGVAVLLPFIPLLLYCRRWMPVGPSEIPFGPFLIAGALAAHFGWQTIDVHYRGIVELAEMGGWKVVTITLFSLLSVFAAVFMFLRLLRKTLGG